MSEACNTNMPDAILRYCRRQCQEGMHVAQPISNTDVATVERVGRLAMVLIADVLALLMMIEQPEHKATTAMAVEK